MILSVLFLLFFGYLLNCWSMLFSVNLLIYFCIGPVWLPILGTILDCISHETAFVHLNAIISARQPIARNMRCIVTW